MPDCFSRSGDEAVQNCENCVSGEERRAGDECWEVLSSYRICPLAHREAVFHQRTDSDLVLEEGYKTLKPYVPTPIILMGNPTNNQLRMGGK